MNYYEEALKLQDSLTADRRYLHTNAELGLEMPKARAYILKRLAEMGIEGKPCGEAGVTAIIGQGEKTLLLRADMDALPMGEDSGLDFACPAGDRAHCCGHDLHAAMLLTAAQLLKKNESALKGKVKLMFQPGEETFQGGWDMLKSGILEDPKPDAALAYHVGPGRMPTGLFMYNSGGTMMYSVDVFTINIQGKGGHGGIPQSTIDPINIGVHIHLALQELIARECDPACACVLTVGQFSAGSAANIIPDTAIMKGTVRCDNEEARQKLVNRMAEVADATARVYGGSAEVIVTDRVPLLKCDKTVTDTMVKYMQELPIPGLMGYPGITASASEDFAVIAERIPSAFMYLSAGFTDERGAFSAHNPKVLFNEDVLPIGAACYAHCAQRYLEENC